MNIYTVSLHTTLKIMYNDPAMNYNKTKTQKLLLCFIITYSCTIITIHSQTQPNTTNPDSFILACGATTQNPTPDANNRKWSSDSTFITPSNNNTSLSGSAQSQDPSLPSTIPYMTARIFKSETTYKFPVLPFSRHWVRLHFYPSPYNNNTYNPSNSFFSVTSNGLTLLNNFSASITAKAFTQAYIIREFTMSKTRSENLNLTFTPANDSFAFINGIEIVSMPDIFKSVPFVDFSMQTMFRLNVGGQYITNGSDLTGRIWYDDSPYIYGAAFGVTNKANSNVTIAYPSKESENIAPLDVYQTGRSMGPNTTVNVNYNLTWVFEVDVNFTYLVRLHFCDYRFEKVNQMVFTIFINNRTAEKEADVIAWSGGKGVPVYKDYATYVSGKNSDGLLWIALHPNVAVKPEFYDAILNGLEIYKVNDTRGNLAGLNPGLLQMRDDSNQGIMIHHSKKNNVGVIVGAVLGTLAGIGLIAGLVITFLNQIKKTESNRSSASSTGGYWLPIYGSSRSSSRTTNTTSKSSGSSSRISSLSGGHCRHFTLHEIRLGTENFSESKVIGIGGFGKVYKGLIDGKTKTVAIKRSNPLSEQGVHEFLNEIDLLSKLRHRHLVSLIGACEENEEMILVYDYMANGTLREHLYKTENNNNPTLSWCQRLGICIGAARGIHYLHTGAKHTIIHRDVKSTNILLDEKWVAKVSDFGLSKTGHNLSQTHFSTVVKGSFGYLDPEYFRRQQLTDKSDVYSFGVVLFEVLCGRPALSPSLPREQASLADWAILNCNRDSLEDIIDPCIANEIHPECLKQFIETAVKCLSDRGVHRPSMGEVLWNLEYCMQLQSNPDGPKVVAQQRASDACAPYADVTTLVSIEEESEKSEEIEDHSENITSLEIVNPKGR
ncbi:hypothetical protein CASFOL_021715 [Castilleja foliolosa]|uniref:Protein kinase domain-containing protein n=1 Tax=Castilleja foliolosa TaxID=1961234 RepID=A0ABD3D0T6_9LAMI